MRKPVATLCLSLSALLSLCLTSHAKPNVLFLCVDDWNDWVGCLGDGSVQTPNMDRLAAMGTLFTNAHCAAPVCNPSRAAVMSGLRPSTTGVYENGSPLQLALPEGHLTLPQYFRKQGYVSHGSGKIYHDQIGFNFPQDWDHYFLWNEIYRTWAWECGYSRSLDPQPSTRPFAKITSKTKRNFDFAPLPCEDREMPDFKSTDYAVQFLKQEHDRPFFLAVGQFKPHLPWFAPQKYFDLYPIEEIELPPVLDGDIDDLPLIAKKRAVDRASKQDQVQGLGEWKKAIQGYKACISFSDAQIGRVLDALESRPDKDNTIIAKRSSPNCANTCLKPKPLMHLTTTKALR
jgi:arylsulfatase A-like enzyme